MPAGDTQPLTATGLYSDGSSKDLTASVTWSSSNTAAATVSPSGLVTGVATGAATITATDPSSLLSGTAVITVLPAVLLTVTVSPSPAFVPIYGTAPLRATGTYSDGTTKDVTDQVTWSSSDSSVARVANGSNPGLATGVAVGSTTITATPSSGLPGITTINVTGPAIGITPDNGGPRRTHVTVNGQGFVPGSTIRIVYRTELTAPSKPKVIICTAVVNTQGTFSCSGVVPGTRGGGGPAGAHTVFAKVPKTKSILATTTFTRDS